MQVGKEQGDVEVQVGEDQVAREVQVGEEQGDVEVEVGEEQCAGDIEVLAVEEQGQAQLQVEVQGVAPAKVSYFNVIHIAISDRMITGFALFSYFFIYFCRFVS